MSAVRYRSASPGVQSSVLPFFAQPGFPTKIGSCNKLRLPIFECCRRYKKGGCRLATPAILITGHTHTVNSTRCLRQRFLKWSTPHPSASSSRQLHPSHLTASQLGRISTCTTNPLHWRPTFQLPLDSEFPTTVSVRSSREAR